eukprot:768688-Hanusia_phi.AAC.3
MKRVCKPGGNILLLENSISGDTTSLSSQKHLDLLLQDNKLFAAYQKLTAPMVANMGGKGCFYDQDPVDLATQAGLQVIASNPVPSLFLLSMLLTSGRWDQADSFEQSSRKFEFANLFKAQHHHLPHILR